VKNALRIGWILLCLILALSARCWNLRDVFVEGKIYFVDADCYSRMTRVQQILQTGRPILRKHDFENWPAGVTPHTTAPMDWTIIAGKWVLDAGFAIFERAGTSLLHAQTLDLSGALVSPLLGLLTCGFLAIWGWQQKASGWLAPPLFFAVSPVLVHGTLLGRPDHQSLLILLLTIALAAEVTLAKALVKGWGIVAGGAWALAMWVSFYEPLVLLAVALVFWHVADRRRFVAREMHPGWLVFAAVLAISFLIDGWRLSWPDPALQTAFLRWQHSIGELAHLDPRAPLLYRWLGVGILLTPLTLIGAAVLARRRLDQALPALLALLLVLVSFGLTVWQLRWGYFLALAFALSLPAQFALVRRTWIVWPIFVLTLWPLAGDWDEKLFPEDHPEFDTEKQRGVQRLESVRLRELAQVMRTRDRRPFLAPWWLSPALAYWSGQPGVAGSSHESLPGIVATAQFFLAPDAAEMERLARERGVKWIVTDDPDRLVETSRVLLDRRGEKTTPFVVQFHTVAEPRERVSAEDLRAASPEARARLADLANQAEAAQLGTAAFSCVSTNQFYKLFTVKDATP
jgi:hypothetical protein